MIRTVIVLVLLVSSLSYLQLPIHRIPSGHKTVFSTPPTCGDNSDEVCYYKDISYCVQLINDKQVYMIAVDFTIPISWIKHPACKVQNSSKCTLLERSLASSIKSSIVSIQRKMRGKKQAEEALPLGEKTTTGSMYPLSGIVEKGENIHFETKDSNKFFSVYKLFLIGTFLTDEKDHILLKNTNFINATDITDHTNKLSDGAISVRFDSESENSFLNEIFQFVGQEQRTMTVYLGDNNEITLGDLSSKNAADGFSSITWLPLHQKQFLMIDQLSVETEGTEKVHSIESSNQAVFTLSASYISLPKNLLDSLIKQLNTVAKCSLDSSQYLVCSSPSKSFFKKKLVFQIIQYQIAFTVEQLIKEKSGSSEILKIRLSESEYIIVGQPFFKKYYSAFDYLKNRVGIAKRRQSIEQRILSTITLVRFVMVVFLIGVSLLACYRPTKRIMQVWNWYNESKKNSDADAGETRRLKYSTVDVHNQYDDLNSKIRTALEEQEQHI